MGASDNVVRGGLTQKPVDVDDLLAVADPTPLATPMMDPAQAYALEGTSIRLLRINGPATRTADAHELLVTTAGVTAYLAPGAILDLPADVTAYVATS
jgi:mannose-6-phosphate isomerase